MFHEIMETNWYPNIPIFSNDTLYVSDTFNCSFSSDYDHINQLDVTDFEKDIISHLLPLDSPSPSSPPILVSECCSVCNVECESGMVDVSGATVAGYECGEQIGYCQIATNCGVQMSLEEACLFIGSEQASTRAGCGACSMFPPSTPVGGGCLPEIMETVGATGDLLNFKLAADAGVDGEVITEARVGPGFYLFKRNSYHPVYSDGTSVVLPNTGTSNDWPYNIPNDKTNNFLYYVLYVSVLSADTLPDLYCGVHPAMKIALTYDETCTAGTAPSPPAAPAVVASSQCSYEGPIPLFCHANGRLDSVAIASMDDNTVGLSGMERSHALCCEKCMNNPMCYHYALLYDTGNGQECWTYGSALDLGACEPNGNFGQTYSKVPFPQPPSSPPGPPSAPPPPFLPPPPPTPLSPPRSPPSPPLSPTPPTSPPPPGIPWTAVYNSETEFYDCVVPIAGTSTVWPGEHLDMCTGTIFVRGIMVVESDSRITASRIEVESTGSVRIGTPIIPATNVTIYLDHADCEDEVANAREENWSDAATVCLKRGEVLIGGNWHSYGVPVTSWTRLISECSNCITLQVEECRGWAIGDKVVVTAAQVGERPEASPMRHIASIATGADSRNCAIGLDIRTGSTHSGAPTNSELRDSVIRAEVLHFARSIVITGPMHWRNGGTESSNSPNGGQGIITRAIDDGEVVMHYHHMENCGRVLLGSYCHHLHHRRQAGGEFKGISVLNSVSKAFTIHGTSGARVEAASIYNHRGAAIYLENGAEHNNIIIGNAISCEIRSSTRNPRCAITLGVGSQSNSDFGEQSGIYMTSMLSAAVIGNAISGQDNALFVNQAGKANGRDEAEGLVAPAATRMAVQRDNVFHDNDGFGWYVNRHSLLKTEIDPENGFVSNWASACAWNFVTGEDNAVPGVLENHIEFGNDFGMGSYDLSDFTCRNCSLFSNAMGIYWKTYRRSKNAPPLLEGGSIYNKWHTISYGQRVAINSFRLPGGQGLVEFKDVNIAGPVKVGFNHHCNMDTQTTGGMCASSYFFNNVTNPDNWHVDFEEETEGDKDTSMVFQYGANPSTDETLIIGTSKRTFDPSSVGCRTAVVQRANEAWWCPGTLKIRPLVIFSPHRGTLSVTSTHSSDNEGNSRATAIAPRTKVAQHGVGMGGNYCPYGRNSASGYTMLVLGGAELVINIPDMASQLNGDEWSDYFVLYYSEEQWPVNLKSSITVTVSGIGADTYGIDGGPFEISSDHSRAYTTPYGAYVSEAGAWWEAKKTNGSTAVWSEIPTFLSASAYEIRRTQVQG